MNFGKMGGSAVDENMGWLLKCCLVNRVKRFMFLWDRRFT